MTDVPPDPRLRAWRGALCATVICGFGLLGGLTALCAAAEREFKALNMEALPALTELCFAIAALARTPLGAVLSTLTAGMCVLIVVKGKMDSRARDLTIALAIALVICVLFVAAALYLPLRALHVI